MKLLRLHMERQAFGSLTRNPATRHHAHGGRQAGSPGPDVIATNRPSRRAPPSPASRARLCGFASRVWHWTGFAWRSPGQRLAGDSLVVEQATAAALAARYTLTGARLGIPSARPLVQSGDPRIVTQARKIIGGERDPAPSRPLCRRLVHGTSRETARDPASAGQC